MQSWVRSASGSHVRPLGSAINALYAARRGGNGLLTCFCGAVVGRERDTRIESLVWLRINVSTRIHGVHASSTDAHTRYTPAQKLCDSSAILRNFDYISGMFEEAGLREYMTGPRATLRFCEVSDCKLKFSSFKFPVSDFLVSNFPRESSRVVNKVRISAGSVRDLFSKERTFSFDFNGNIVSQGSEKYFV